MQHHADKGSSRKLSNNVISCNARLHDLSYQIRCREQPQQQQVFPKT